MQKKHLNNKIFQAFTVLLFVLVLTLTGVLQRYVKMPITASATPNYSITVDNSRNVIAVKSDGTVWGKGPNSDGELGLGNKSSVSSWTQLSISNVKKVLLNCNGAAFALKFNNTLWATGYNGNGQFGNYLGFGYYTNWVQIASNVIDFSCSGDGGATFIIKSDNTMLAAGSFGQGWVNNFTQLYTNVKKVSTDMVLFNDGTVQYFDPRYGGWYGTGLTNIVDIFQDTYSYRTLFAIKSNGTVWADGDNSYGQLGFGNVNSVGGWTQTPMTTISYVFGSGWTTFFYKSDGTLWSCGDDTYSEQGFYGGNATVRQTASNVLMGASTYFPMGQAITYIVESDGWLYYSTGGGWVRDINLFNDNTPPTTPMVTVSPSGWTNGSVTFSLYSTDSDSSFTYQYSTDNVHFFDCGSSFTWSNQGITTIYFRAYDPSWNVSPVNSGVAYIDTSPPTYTSATITNVSASGYDFYMYGVSDNLSEVDHIAVPTWTNYNGQDDITYGNAVNLGGGTWYYRVNRSDHLNEFGLYYTAPGIYDKVNNQNWNAGWLSATLTSTPTLTIITPPNNTIYSN